MHSEPHTTSMQAPTLTRDAKIISQRPDLLLLEQWISAGSSVLDLGCGNGVLLNHLQTHKQVSGYGLEINPLKITACLARGVSVIEQDLNDGLNNFGTDQFDTVIMSQTLQAVTDPVALLSEMLRVGISGIVSFPNFGYWRVRYQLAAFGTMPVSDSLPYEWYDTPNIHLCTVRDFERLCARQGYSVLDKWVVNDSYVSLSKHRLFPNLFGKIALYHITAR